MDRKKASKICHFASTAWFVLSISYIFILALLNNGKGWLIILSVSGYSVLIAFLLVSLYLFAAFRGFAKSQNAPNEHPLTTDHFYSLFYDLSPFLGALAGLLAAVGIARTNNLLLLTATGSVWITFLVWIIIDPIAGLVEMLLPSSREHRHKRLAETRKIQKEELLVRQELLKKIELQKKTEKEQWREILQPYAEKLTMLAGSIDQATNYSDSIKTEVMDIGVIACQMGGVNCMAQLYSMTMEICRQKHRNPTIVEYISIWWDGIGSWKNSWLEGENNLILKGRTTLCEA